MKTKFTMICMLTLLAYACGKDDDSSPYKCSDCATTPEANADYDDSGLGIYKGTVVGSTGTIKFDMGNSGTTTYTAELTIDDEVYELTTEGLFTETGFDDYFYGTKSTPNDIVVGFYVNAGGTSYEVWIESLPGHPDASATIYKELSTSLVRVYEGDFEGDATGVFNMVTVGDEWSVVAKEDGNPDSSFCYGVIQDNTIVSACDIEITGSVSDDNVSGQWVAGDDNGSWTGKRTL